MSDGVTVKVVNAKQLEKWFGDWYAQSLRSQPAMFAMATFYLQQIFRTFKLQGARDGFSAWPTYNKGKGHILGGTTRTKVGTWNIRYGTDKVPKRTAEELAAYKTENNLWYKRGPMKGYKSDRRYSAQSKLLQASGNFRNSFRSILVSKQRAVVGTTMPKADKIVKGRPVIRISSQDRSQFAKLLLRHFVPKGSTT